MTTSQTKMCCIMSKKYGCLTPTKYSNELPHRRKKQWQTISGLQRITLPKNLSIIMNLNGLFKNFWRVPAFVLSRGFKINEVGNEEKFNEGNLPKTEYNIMSTLSFAPVKAGCLKSWVIASRLKGKAIRLLGKQQLFSSGVLTCVC